MLFVPTKRTKPNLTIILQIIKLKSRLPEQDLINKAQERKPHFEVIPGLLQKYYVKLDKPGFYGGIYVWDSAASMLAFKESDLAKSIPAAYEIVEAPEVEVMDVFFQLRNMES